MVVKNKETPIAIIQNILKNQNGILRTSDLDKYKIPRIYISIMEKNGDIQRISRGVYSTKDTIVDEMFELQARYKSAIFSHETATYLLDLTDRTPLFYSVTIPSGYNATLLKTKDVKVYFVRRDLYPLGLIKIKSPFGNEIMTFNPERTICDLFRSRSRIDIQQINQIVKRYATKREANINLLYAYAQKFSIQKMVRETLEVLL